MANGGIQSNNSPKRPIDEKEYKKRLIEDIRTLNSIPEDNEDIIEDELIDDEEEFDESDEQEEQQPEISRDDIERLTKEKQPPTEKQKLDKEYQYESPGTKKVRPGGEAIKPKAPTTGTAAKAEQGAAKTGRGIAQAGKSAAQGVKKGVQAAAKTAQAIAKAVQAAVAAVRNAVAAIGALFETAPVWVPIVLIILGILVIVGGVVIFLKARQTPNTNGASPTISADIINDRPWISKILALSGDPNIATKMTDEVLNGLLLDLSAVESELISTAGIDQQTRDKAVAKISEIKNLVSQFKSLEAGDANRATTAKSIITSVAQLLDLFSGAPFHYAGETQYPIDPKKITGYNNTLHGGTPMRRWPSSGHNTFINYLRGSNDAVDIIANGGTPVYAAFDAKINEIRNRYGKVYLVSGVDQEGKKWQAVYAHLQSLKFSVGDTIHKGDQIGELYSGLNSPHLHFEILCNGKAVTTNREDMANCRNTSDGCSSGARYNRIGKYLYVRILSSLNLTP